MEKILKKPQNLAVLSLLLSIGVALRFSATIQIGNYIRIGFSNLPIMVSGTLFGPIVGAVFGAALDIINFLVKPTGPFFPGFTLTAALRGALYGLIFYKRSIKFLRVLFAEILEKVFLNVFFNSIWLKIMYKQAIAAMLPARALENLIMLPIDTIIVFLLLNVVLRAYQLAERES